MSVNLVAKLRRQVARAVYLLGESSWVLFCFFAVIAIVFGTLFHLFPGIESALSTTIGQLVSGGLLYALVLGVVVLPIWIMFGRRYVGKILGVDRTPLRSIWWMPAALWFTYMAVTIFVAFGLSFVPGFNSDERQQVGFENLQHLYEYVLAFVALVIVPPIAEELLFRGYLFGRLRERWGFWVTTATVSAVFGLVHLQWNVGVDVAILSIFLCYLREKTGTVWAGMILHALKNSLAYFVLFIAPLLGMHLGQ